MLQMYSSPIDHSPRSGTGPPRQQWMDTCPVVGAAISLQHQLTSSWRSLASYSELFPLEPQESGSNGNGTGLPDQQTRQGN